MHQESRLQTQVSNYLHRFYPTVIFECDTGSGMKRSLFMGALQKKWRSGSGFPDMKIYERRGEWSMLMMELKAEKAPLYMKDGVTLRKIEHLKNQSAMHIKLRNSGYYACFGKGLEHCIKIINWYMDGAEGNPPKYNDNKSKGLF